MPERHYADGEWVVTRRGKRGQVVRGTGDTILVLFGGKEFEIKPTAVISASAYRSYSRGKPVPGQGIRR